MMVSAAIHAGKNVTYFRYCLFCTKRKRKWWRNLIQSGGTQVNVNKLWEIFLIKRFTLTADPILIVLLKPI